MTTSVACKTSYVTPPSGQYAAEPVDVIAGQKGCDRGQVVGSGFNLMEMTEVEYAHLQHLIQSHMDSQDVAEEVRISPPSSTDREGENSCKVCPSAYTSPVCQPDPDASSSPALPTGVQFVSAPGNQGSEDNQEVQILLYSDPSSISSLGESTPAGNGEVPGSTRAKMRCYAEAARERNNHRRVLPLGSRPVPTARVCLEKRFNCESQAAALNTFLSMLHNSTDMPGIAMHSQPEKSPKAEKTAAVECAHPYTDNKVKKFYGIPSCQQYRLSASLQTKSIQSHPLLITIGPFKPQGLGHFSQLLEVSKHPEGTASMNLSFNKSADSVSKSLCIIYTDTTNEEQAINIENEVGQKAVKQIRKRGDRALHAQDPNIMQGPGKWKPVCLMSGRKPVRRTQPLLGINQRKERHNLKERDRRRRIRLCCDELNMLVPFCYAETDRATTLQWTTAYLKYIREVYGDSLKQGFQNTFCGKTGLRIKQSCTSDAAKCGNSASKE